MAAPHDSRNESQRRLEALRKLILEKDASTQEELCEALRKKNFDVTQSTVSRDLRRIGAVKVNNAQGEIVYHLPAELLNLQLLQPRLSHDLTGLVTGIQSNEFMIVLHTTPGSASLVARHLDNMREQLGTLGTIAGDDTIFIAPSSSKKIPALMKRIKEEF